MDVAHGTIDALHLHVTAESGKSAGHEQRTLVAHVGAQVVVGVVVGLAAQQLKLSVPVVVPAVGEVVLLKVLVVEEVGSRILPCSRIRCVEAHLYGL